VVTWPESIDRQALLARSEEWNESRKGKKYGRISIVADASEADIILASWTDRGDVTTSTRVVSGTNTVYVPSGVKGVRGTYQAVPTVSSYDATSIPVYNYVISVREGGIHIHGRHVLQVSQSSLTGAFDDLWEGVTQALKKRGNIKHLSKGEEP
jgi:hypothetical protein